MSDKYIIKNCPCYFNKPEANCWADQLSWCENITYCKLKQIVELCKDAQKECSCKNPNKDVDCFECTSGGRAELGTEILQLLDIEECE
jgi:hypothetical protein